tara:strand:- start:667 stop:873 length:207 start_codon:yes stop_codon:yes gene_type:complete
MADAAIEPDLTKRFNNQELHDCLAALTNACMTRGGGWSKESFVRITKDDWDKLEALRIRLERTLDAGR